ncbi:hypothetical protein BY996DRAFT_6937267, partial [Phakopsora pachyrhizi]
MAMQYGHSHNKSFKFILFFVCLCTLDSRLQVVFLDYIFLCCKLFIQCFIIIYCTFETWLQDAICL